MLRTEIQFPPEHAALRDDVHMLGELVGQILREQGGDSLFELVEQDRMLSINRRNGDAAAASELEFRVKGRDPALARDLERAFSAWFQAVNLAEQVHRIRRRRTYFLIESDKPQPGGVDAAIGQLKFRGKSLAEVMDLLATLRIEPVFVAHPNESPRRTVLRKELRMAGLLYGRLDPTLAPNEQRALRGKIRSEMTTAWQTEDHPRERLTVADEREHVIFYLVEVLYRVVPGFHEEIAAALEKHYGVAAESLDVPTIISFGTWVGSDLDGNPDVNAKTLRETLARQQQVIINAYFIECQALSQLLSQSTNRCGVSPALEQRINDYKNLFPSAKDDSPMRHDRMQYRIFFNQVAQRLRLTYGGRANGYESPEQLTKDVQLVADSLLAHRGRHAGFFSVKRLLRRVSIFGFHLASLDVRQHSSVHHTVIAQGLNDSTWKDLTANERNVQLRTLIERDIGPRIELDAMGRRTLGVFDAIVQCRRRFGVAAIGSYIVSGVQSSSDILAAFLLAQWAQAYDKDKESIAVDFAPMFDSVEGLVCCSAVLQDLMSDPLYRRHIDVRGHKQTVLLGYSEISKQTGICASRFAVYEAQKALNTVLSAAGERQIIMHARGGSIARGGGRIDDIVTSMPPSTVNGVLRLTEQGEGISHNYGLGPIALRTLERAFSALSLATMGDSVSVVAEPNEKNLELASIISVASALHYRGLVFDTIQFHDYFRAVTPIDVIERMQIGGRPSSHGNVAGVLGLHAVPWVSAWTQNRMMMPGWFGAGTGLQAGIKAMGMPATRLAWQSWPFFHSLVDDLERMLARSDFVIAQHYQSLASAECSSFFKAIREEYVLACEVVLAIKEYDKLLDCDRMQQRSLQLRNPYVDPMNFMQVDLLKRWRSGGREDSGLFDALLASIGGISNGLQSIG